MIESSLIFLFSEIKMSNFMGNTRQKLSSRRDIIERKKQQNDIRKLWRSFIPISISFLKLFCFFFIFFGVHFPFPWTNRFFFFFAFQSKKRLFEFMFYEHHENKDTIVKLHLAGIISKNGEKKKRNLLFTKMKLGVDSISIGIVRLHGKQQVLALPAFQYSFP